MKWIKPIIGILVAMQCIVPYLSAFNDFNLFFQGWHGSIGKGIVKALVGTMFLLTGIYIIRPGLLATRPQLKDEYKEISTAIVELLHNERDPLKNKSKEKLQDIDFLNYLCQLVIKKKNVNKIADCLTKNSKRNMILDQDKKHDLMIATKLNNIKI